MKINFPPSLVFLTAVILWVCADIAKSDILSTYSEAIERYGEPTKVESGDGSDYVEWDLGERGFIEIAFLDKVAHCVNYYPGARTGGLFTRDQLNYLQKRNKLPTGIFQRRIEGNDGIRGTVFGLNRLNVHTRTFRDRVNDRIEG
ncbi:MAG: hypothetical protein GY811_06015 [Myxococcales bacterium]|nr:hypothetical protein [Myxococcales bacterium]